MIYDKTKVLKYYKCVKEDISNLRKEEERIEKLITSLKMIDLHGVDTVFQNGVDTVIQSGAIITKINEKLGDLCVEEANEHEIGSQEYKNIISEAKGYYNEALEYLIEQQKNFNNNEFENSINRIKEKLAKLERL